MGYFGTFAFSNGRWAETPTDNQYLGIDIHDSSIATIDYQPAANGHGRFYLGYEPRHYFDDPSASQPIDTAAETAGFIAWVSNVIGVDLSAEQLTPLLADADGGEPDDVFVEDTVVTLINLLGLPLPADLQPTSN